MGNKQPASISYTDLFAWSSGKDYHHQRRRGKEKVSQIHRISSANK